MSETIKLKCVTSTRSRRFLKKKLPLLNENDKYTVIFKNGKMGTSSAFLSDIKLLKKPNVKNYELTERVSIFEDASKLDKIFEKFDCGLFAMGSHSKKRPNNVIFGRTFDHHILDMYEFEITDYKPMDHKKDSFNVGSKPVLIFTDFPSDSDNMPNFYLKTLLIDFFRGPKITNLCKTGIEYSIHFRSVDKETISMSVCKIMTEIVDDVKTVSNVEEIGPFCNLKIRRQQLPEPTLWKKALKKPTSVKVKKVKNVEKDIFGNVYGRVHMSKVDDPKIAGLVAFKEIRKRKKASRNSNGNEKMETDE